MCGASNSTLNTQDYERLLGSACSEATSYIAVELGLDYTASRFLKRVTTILAYVVST